MKYIPLVILLICLDWTWCLATGDRALKLEEHKRVEAGVEQDIRGFINRRFPGTNEVYCSQLYPGTDLIAHFRCQAVGNLDKDDAAEQVFEGHLNLRSVDGFMTWAETGGEIAAREVNFLNGFKITPEGAAPKADGK